MAEVILKGFDELARGLENAESLFLPLATQAMAYSLEALHEAFQMIPSQPDRDRAWKPGRPRPYNTYVRNVGQYPRSAFSADFREPGGYKVKNKTKMKKAGKVRLTSQQSSKRWKMTVMADPHNVIGMLRNDATYSGYVWGYAYGGGTPVQSPFHHQTGWISTEEAITLAEPEMERSFEVALKQFTDVLSRR